MLLCNFCKNENLTEQEDLPLHNHRVMGKRPVGLPRSKQRQKHMRLRTSAQVLFYCAEWYLFTSQPIFLHKKSLFVLLAIHAQL